MYNANHGNTEAQHKPLDKCIQSVYYAKHVNNKPKGNKMNTYTKAMQVQNAYEAAFEHNTHSEGCYALAVAAAHELGGIEIANSNDGNSTISFAPTRTFEFDDASAVQVTYGGVWVIEPNQPY